MDWEKERKDEMSGLDLSSFGYYIIYRAMCQLESDASTQSIPCLGNIFSSPLPPYAYIQMPLLCVSMGQTERSVT